MFKYLLYPFTIIYSLLSYFNKVLTKQKKLYKPVISIGNITWGGSGKTPMTMLLALGSILVHSLALHPRPRARLCRQNPLVTSNLSSNQLLLGWTEL